LVVKPSSLKRRGRNKITLGRRVGQKKGGYAPAEAKKKSVSDTLRTRLGKPWVA